MRFNDGDKLYAAITVKGDHAACFGISGHELQTVAQLQFIGVNLVVISRQQLFGDHMNLAVKQQAVLLVGVIGRHPSNHQRSVNIVFPRHALVD